MPRTREPGARRADFLGRVRRGRDRPGNAERPRHATGEGARLILAQARERSLLRRHPWVFSGAIDRVEGDPAAGDTVTVVSASGDPLARAAYSPSSQIRARVWSFDPGATIDAGFIEAAVVRAVRSRDSLVATGLDGVRLIHSESDGLPGVVADRYGDTAVLQCSSTGAERWREAIADALVAHAGCVRVYERSDLETRALEGLAERVGVVRGDEPPARIVIREGAARYPVDVRTGQKTGFFLDQRDNRARVAAMARGADVLDVFAYTGGFTIAALSGGARSVTAIDSSRSALALARETAELNAVAAEAVEWIEEDAFAALRRLRDAGRRFDLIVLDPPKFAPTAKHAERAARAYKDVNLGALRLLRPGGTLHTFSCSGGIDAMLFQSIVAGAAVDAGVDARVLATLTAGADHAVALAFPEGAYLKGLVLRRG